MVFPMAAGTLATATATDAAREELCMNEEIRAAALRAAAKLTVGMGVVGCGSAALVEVEDTATEESAVASGETASARGAEVYAPRVRPCDGGARAPQPRTCDVIFAEAFPDGAPSWFESLWPQDGGPSVVHSEEVAACCVAILTEADGGDPNDWKATERFRNAGCCSVAVDSPVVGTHCTPWGPPAPPAMPGIA